MKRGSSTPHSSPTRWNLSASAVSRRAGDACEDGGGGVGYLAQDAAARLAEEAAPALRRLGRLFQEAREAELWKHLGAFGLGAPAVAARTPLRDLSGGQARRTKPRGAAPAWLRGAAPAWLRGAAPAWLRGAAPARGSPHLAADEGVREGHVRAGWGRGDRATCFRSAAVRGRASIMMTAPPRDSTATSQ
jgi:hypothetical protein